MPAFSRASRNRSARVVRWPVLPRLAGNMSERAFKLLRARCGTRTEGWLGLDSVQFGSVGGHQQGSALFLDQNDDKLRRLSFARVSAHDMNVIWIFVEGLTRCQRNLLSAFHLHHDRAFH